MFLRSKFTNELMVKQELLGVNERPNNIFVSVAPAGQGFLRVLSGGCFGDVIPGQTGFLFVRLS